MRPGELVAIEKTIWRLLAPNAGLMTGPGTNTYFVEHAGQVCVIDPGPADTTHVDAIIALAPAPITVVAVTHTHRDHSPAAAELIERTGADAVGLPPPPTIENDQNFVGSEQPLEALERSGFNAVLEIVATPGHASNHLCYRHNGYDVLFTGDHIMNGSTVVIMPPDGDMADYLGSLRKLLDLAIRRIAPGHGGVMEDPKSAINALIEHRLRRESKVLNALKAIGPGSLRELVKVVYQEVDPQLHGWAERSLQAHLIKLQTDGLCQTDESDWWAI